MFRTQTGTAAALQTLVSTGLVTFSFLNFTLPEQAPHRSDMWLQRV